jgi:hypothetical protein
MLTAQQRLQLWLPQLYLISLAVFEGVHIKQMAHQHSLFSLDEGQ